MTDLCDRIIAALHVIPSANAAMLSQDIGESAREVQNALHDLDDQGKVIMRNGWYRLSEAERKANG